MTSPLSSFVTVKFVNDGDAAPADVALAGQTFKLPPEYLATIGGGPTNPGIIAGVRGYLRTEADTSHSWVMTSEVTPAQKAAILGVPGGLGWIDQSMAAGTPLRVVFNVARSMVQAGIAGPTVLDAVTKLVRAGADNRNAQIAAGG